ncbi:MAG: amidase [Pseudomonadales bacterium]|nr:amidase [Pseudomonadales bacterium]
MQAFLEASAVDLAKMIREQRVSSSAVVEAHIRRVEQVNPEINALVFDRFAQARHQARAADTAVASAKHAGMLASLPPLLGVPCTIKERFAVCGAPNTAGLVERQHIISDKDAMAVQHIKASGAIVLGVTNTSELCMWMESFNKVYGLTRNPYDGRCTAGGSSGGEGAIVGSGASPFGLGSDIGGSIRMPALFNGVFGHKGSPGLVSNQGQYPFPRGIAEEMLSTGPLCRRATDLPLLLGIMAGNPTAFEHVPKLEVGRLRVLRRHPDSLIRADRAQAHAQSQAIRLLVEAGAREELIDLRGFYHAFDIWSNTLSSAGSTSFAEMMYGSKQISQALKALINLPRAQSTHTLPLVLLSMLERVPELMPARMQRLVRQGQALRQQLIDHLGSDGVLVDLAYPTTAPRHYRAMVPPWGFVRSAIYNALRLPATEIPMGLAQGGLPTGVQVVAAAGQDALGLAVALYLEHRQGGWVPPWKL